MVIFGVIRDDHDTLAGDATTAFQVLEKFPAGLALKASRLSAGDQPAIPQTNRAKESHTFAGGMMKTNWIFDFRRYPHAAAGTVVLKVDFIHGPELIVWISCQPLEFFYGRRGIARVLRVGRGRKGQALAAASGAESSGVGTIAGNCAPKPRR